MKQLVAFFLALFASAAFAQGYPNKPVRLVVAFTPGSSTDIVAKVNAEVGRALNSPEVVERLAKLGTEPMSMTPAEADAFIRREYEELGNVMRAAGLTPQ